MKMTSEQQDLVARNLRLVDEVIYFKIKRDRNNPDYDMDDLRQIGRIGLCKAAQRFDGTTSFSVFARTAIWREFLGYFKQLKRSTRAVSLDEPDPLGVPYGERLEAPLDVEKTVDNILAFEQLHKLSRRYTGVTQKGIQAMSLRLCGLSSTEVAKLYQVKSNHVRAWMARARTRLVNDRDFQALIS